MTTKIEQLLKKFNKRCILTVRPPYTVERSRLRLLKAVSPDEDVKGLPKLVEIYIWLKADEDFTISFATDLNQVIKYDNGSEIKKTTFTS